MTIGFSEAVYAVSESAGTTVICIDLIGTSERSVLAILSTAVSDSQDFQLPNVPTLVFQSGQSQVCTSVTVISDAIVEGLESFTLELSTSDLAVDNNFRMTALLNIIDDDSKLINCCHNMPTSSLFPTVLMLKGCEEPILTRLFIVQSLVAL